MTSDATRISISVIRDIINYFANLKLIRDFAPTGKFISVMLEQLDVDDEERAMVESMPAEEQARLPMVYETSASEWLSVVRTATRGLPNPEPIKIDIPPGLATAPLTSYPDLSADKSAIKFHIRCLMNGSTKAWFWLPINLGKITADQVCYETHRLLTFNFVNASPLFLSATSI